MPVRTFNPASPAVRSMTVSTFEEITKFEPEKSLVQSVSRKAGRNVYGRITSRFRGGGHKRMYRIIDFKRDKRDVSARVIAVEYDPYRTARLALLQYQDGEKRYILAPVGLKLDDVIKAGEDADIKTGNALPLKKIPLGSQIHNIEVKKDKGGQLVRGAGTAAQLMAKEDAYAQVRLPSGEVRKIHVECFATIGQVGNIDHENISLGKAGRSRWLGRRPHVRGSVMNPCDHPHGGGEGKSSEGRPPVSPWGQQAKGLKTRRNLGTEKMIIKHRR